MKKRSSTMFPMTARPTRLCHKRSPVECVETASSMMVPRMTVAVAVHKTRSDLLSPGTRVAADVGWGPAPGMTKDNLWMEPVRALPQGQALAGDRCITTTLATRVNDGSHAGGFRTRAILWRFAQPQPVDMYDNEPNQCQAQPLAGERCIITAASNV